MIRPAILAAALVLAAPLAAQAIPATQLLIRESTATVDYRWTAAPEAALEPALLRSLRAEAVADQAKFRAQAVSDAAEARRAGLPVRPYASSLRWTAAAETRPLLALRGESYSFTGGAHGNSGTSALIFDRAAKRRIGWQSLFTDAAKAEALIRPAFCKELDAQRAARRGSNAAQLADFNACPAFKDLAIIPTGGVDRVAFMTLVAAPYVAGPYAEGGYEVKLPLTPELVRLVRPAYRSAFVGG